jgi:hypothetical protein
MLADVMIVAKYLSVSNVRSDRVTNFFPERKRQLVRISFGRTAKSVKYEGIYFVSVGTRAETKIVSSSRGSLHSKRDGCTQIERAYYSIFSTASKLFQV